jgi:hypothetical protein
MDLIGLKQDIIVYVCDKVTYSVTLFVSLSLCWLGGLSTIGLPPSGWLEYLFTFYTQLSYS